MKARIRSSVRPGSPFAASLLAVGASSFFAGSALAQETSASPKLELSPPQPAAPPAAPPPPAFHETRREMERAAVPQPSPPVSAVPAPTPAELSRRRVSVQIDATKRGAVLERRVSVKELQGAFLILPYKSTEGTWEQVCITPCSADLDRYSTYRVTAQNHITGSANFTLPQGADALHLKVKAGSLATHRVAEAMSGIGIAAVITGVSLLGTASEFPHPDKERAAGGITVGGGVLLAAVGIPLAIASSTKVTADSEEEIAQVYVHKGHEVPFLPNIDLGHGFTLTQRGIAF